MDFKMKVKMSLVILSVGLSSLSFADAEAPPTNHPCAKIEAACTAAGFIKKRHKEGKGLWKDCMKPIVDGQSVAGVTVDAADVAGCQAKRAAKKAK